MEATQVVHWPGKDTAACDKHLQQLVGLGASNYLDTVCTYCMCKL